LPNVISWVSKSRSGAPNLDGRLRCVAPADSVQYCSPFHKYFMSLGLRDAKWSLVKRVENLATKAIDMRVSFR
jgi:hypothetical protein